MIVSQLKGVSVTSPTKTDIVPTEPVVTNIDSAWRLIKETSLMENTQDELKAHLMETDEEFRRLVEQHTQYHQQLEALESRSHLSSQEQVEEHRLKKLKLHLKDQINAILARSRVHA